MEKIDVKDRKILYQLDLDSRQSFRNIGRKVGLSKDVVASRVKSLQDNAVIIRFNTIVDYLKLGYTSLRFYFKYQYFTPETKKEIIDHFVNFEHSSVVASLEGSHDLCVYVVTKDMLKIYAFWQKTLEKYRDYFANQITSVYVGEIYYPKSFLIDEKGRRTNHMFKFGGRTVEYDELDYQILQILTRYSRTPTIEIAEKLNKTSTTINKRIKKLIELGIIHGFTVTLDWEKLGYRWFKVDLYLKEYKKIHQIIKYLEANPHLVYIDKHLGYADLELEFILEDANLLKLIIDGISSKFPNIIRRYSYFYVKTSHKWVHMPDE